VVDVDADAPPEPPAPPAAAGVLAITRRAPGARRASGATDWLVWPATPAHVRAKLRAAVLRRACRWEVAARPADEPQRLAALHALGLLDTEPEDRFDRLTAEACAALHVPIALVTLVDEDRQFFKSRHGTDVVESPRDDSLCAHAILQPDVMQVPDLLEDPRFADSPAVTGPTHARFYAGVPLVLRDGSRVGTLCVVDHRPRLLDDRQLGQLRRLARRAQAELEAPAAVRR
jgi:GAF domain-containing protein